MIRLRIYPPYGFPCFNPVCFKHEAARSGETWERVIEQSGPSTNSFGRPAKFPCHFLQREIITHGLSPRFSFVVTLANDKGCIGPIPHRNFQQVPLLGLLRPRLNGLRRKLSYGSNRDKGSPVNADILRGLASAFFRIVENPMARMADGQEIRHIMIGSGLINVVNHSGPIAANLAFPLNCFQLFNASLLEKIMILVFGCPAIPPRIPRALHRRVPMDGRGFQRLNFAFLFAHQVAQDEYRINQIERNVNSIDQLFTMVKTLITKHLLKMFKIIYNLLKR